MLMAIACLLRGLIVGMFKSVFLLLALIGILSACANDSAKYSSGTQIPMVVGGYSKITNPDADQELFQVTKFLSSEIGLIEHNPSLGLARVLNAQRQVVAGSNYLVKVQMTDGSQYEAVVYVNLQNEMSLTSLEKL